MQYIAHRGNISGKKPGRENTIDYILEAMNYGYDVEIDLWKTPDGFYLGHDEPLKNVPIDFLRENADRLWVHCKNMGALDATMRWMNSFVHNTDMATITSKGFVWVFPGKPLITGAIAVMPENTKEYTVPDINLCSGICSDEISKWKERF